MGSSVSRVVHLMPRVDAAGVMDVGAATCDHGAEALSDGVVEGRIRYDLDGVADWTERRRLPRPSTQRDRAHCRRVGHRMTGVMPRPLHDSGPERRPRLTIQGSDLRSGLIRTGIDGYDRNGTICASPGLALRVRRFIDISRIGDGCEWGSGLGVRRNSE